jgi:hypothetical protein
MSEVKILLAALMGLLGAAWWSWTAEDAPKATATVVALEARPSEVQRVSFVTRTQTVAISFREAEGGRYPWFEVWSKTSTRAFTGSEAVDELLDRLAPLKALRSLGRGLPPEVLTDAKLDHPQRRLEIGLTGGPKIFDVGGRTFGARDHYLRPRGGDEVFLVESKVLGDLEYPEGKYMQRKLRDLKLEDVDHVIVAAGGRSKKVLRKNRLSAKDAFWADEATPDARSETLENYLDKVEKLSVLRYGDTVAPLPAGDPVVEVAWHDEGGKVLERLTLSKGVDGEKTIWMARSGLSKVPGEVTRSTAEQLERDLGVVFGD